MSIEKYTTQTLVLAIYDQGEHDRVYKLFTRDYGLVMAHARSIRKLESKLRFHLAVGRTALVTLVKGREVWRITGATDMGDKNLFLHEMCQMLARFIRGEGTHKKLYDKLIELAKNVSQYDPLKARVLAQFILLVDLGYADAKIIGAKNLEEYLSFNVNDLYTHLSLNYKEVRNHIHTVSKETHL